MESRNNRIPKNNNNNNTGEKSYISLPIAVKICGNGVSFFHLLFLFLIHTIQKDIRLTITAVHLHTHTHEHTNT